MPQTYHVNIYKEGFVSVVREADYTALRAMCDELAKMVSDITDECPLAKYEHLKGMPCDPDGEKCNENEGGKCWKLYAKFKADKGAE